MTLRKLKVGVPVLDVLGQNLFWNKVWYDKVAGTPGLYEARFARMWHNEAVVLAGNTLAKGAAGGDDVGRPPFHSYWFQSAAALNDSFENYFALDAGTYDFEVLCRTADNAGIVQWSVDGDVIGTGATDMYSGSGVQYASRIISLVTIATDGNHTLTGLVNSKNGSSTGYRAYIYKYFFREHSEF